MYIFKKTLKAILAATILTGGLALSTNFNAEAAVHSTKIASSKQASTEELKKMFLTTQSSLEKIFNSSSNRQEPLPFSKIRSKLTPYFTKTFIDNDLAEYYTAYIGGTDWFLLGNISRETLDLRFQVLENSATKRTLKTVQLEDEMNEAFYITYYYVKNGSQWLLNSLKYSEIGKGFNITSSEAAKYLKALYINQGYKNVAVHFSKTGTSNTRELGSKGKHYVFIIKGQKGNEKINYKVAMFANNGYIHMLQ